MTVGQSLVALLMFLSVILPVAIIFYARLVKPLKLRLFWRLVWGSLIFIVILIASAGIPLTMILARNTQLAMRLHYDVWCGWPYYLMTFVCALLAVIIIRDVFLLGKKGFIALKNKPKKKDSVNDSASKMAEKSDNPEDLSRRRFMIRTTQLATVGTAVLLVPGLVYHARERRVVKNIDIEFESFPEALNGFRIVHLSDIHVGNTMYRSDVADIVNETNALNPDIIVITGDLVDGYTGVIGQWLEPMRNFKARYGTYFVTGNHDHMYGAHDWCRLLTGLGIRVLDNEHEMIEINGQKLAIAGAIDYRGDRWDRSWKSNPEAALAGIDPGIFKIMLVHQPWSVDRALAAGADLVLLGHTHGGQFWPMNYVVERVNNYVRGLYRFGDKAAFVSCGTGYWGPPLRVGVPPEIDVLTIKNARRMRA